MDDADGPTHYINLASVVTRILEQEKVCIVLYIYTDWLTIYACKSNVLYHLLLVLLITIILGLLSQHYVFPKKAKFTGDKTTNDY